MGKRYENNDHILFLIGICLIAFMLCLLIGISVYTEFHSEEINVPGFSRDGRTFDFRDFAVEEELADFEAYYLDGKMTRVRLFVSDGKETYSVYANLKDELIGIYLHKDHDESQMIPIAEIDQKTDAYHDNDEMPVKIGKYGETTSAWVLYELDFIVNQIQNGRVNAQFARNVLDTTPVSESDTGSSTPVPMPH